MNEMGVLIRDNILNNDGLINSNLHTGLQPLDGDGGGLSSTAEKLGVNGYHNGVLSEPQKRFSIPHSNTGVYGCDDYQENDPAIWNFYVRSESS